MFQILARTSIFFLFLVLARKVDEEIYGEFFFGYSFARLLTLSLMLGSLPVLVKHWGNSSGNTQERVNKNFLYANWYLYIAMALGILIYLISVVFSSFLSLNYTHIENITTLLFVVLIPITLLQNYYISIKKAHLSAATNAFFSLIWLAYTLIYFKTDTNLIDYLYHIIFILCLTNIILYYFSSPRKIFTPSRPKFHNHNFLFGHFVTVAYGLIDVFIIKLFLNSTDVAMYGVAFQLVTSITFLLGAINSSTISIISESFINEKRSYFQKRITYYARIVAFPALFIVLIFVYFGKSILLLYGNQYLDAYYLLVILSIGQLVNTFCGSNGWLLNISNQESYLVKIFSVALTFKIIFGLIMIYYFQLIGLVISSTFSLILWNLLATVKCVKSLGIDTSIFNVLKK